MSQEAITEIDMDVFSRRIGPYFTWLESRIESGWQQNDNVQKDVLKEVKYLATTMRARFILGVSKDDFSKEVQRTIELFNLAMDAFSTESDEIESKIGHFCKGISEELGAHFLPKEYRPDTPRPPQPPLPHPFPTPEPVPEPDHPEEPEEEKIEKKIKIKKPVIETPKAEIKKVAQKIRKESKIKKVEQIQEKPKTAKKPKKDKRKSFFLTRWVKEFIWGPED